MPSWLGVGLAAAFTLVAVHRGVRRDVPGALMAAGMAVMSVGMAGLGPMFVHGPWWAAGFLAVAVWPLVSPRRAGEVCGGPLAHLLGGVAMIYMCALPSMRGGGAAPAVPTALTANTVALAPTGHHHGMAGMGPIDLPGAAQMGIPGPLGAALSVLGWGLACYFLLGTVTALTRRDTSGALTAPRLAVLGEALMGFGTVVMLIAFT
ncbi:MAG TPA: DUF5134 domain-containing protein [Pseudonocardia sp.]|nr:DUF5134 domain-containing protein [Pseudonocardia sp.]